MFLGQDDIPLFKGFARMIFQAWRAREVAFRQSGTPLVPPRIVSGMKQKLAQTTQHTNDACTKQPHDVLGMKNDVPMSMPADSGCHSLLYGMGGQDCGGSEPMPYHDMLGQAALDIDWNDLGWTTMDWDSLPGGDW